MHTLQMGCMLSLLAKQLQWSFQFRKGCKWHLSESVWDFRASRGLDHTRQAAWSHFMSVLQAYLGECCNAVLQRSSRNVAWTMKQGGRRWWLNFHYWVSCSSTHVQLVLIIYKEMMTELSLVGELFLQHDSTDSKTKIMLSDFKSPKTLNISSRIRSQRGTGAKIK